MEPNTEVKVEPKTKKLVLKSITGQDIEVVVKTAISQYEYETEIESVTADEAGKAENQGKKPDWFKIGRHTENKTIETLVVSVTGLEKVTAEGVKKLIDRREYPKLKEALDQTVGVFREVEKKG